MIEKDYPVEIASLTKIQDFINSWCEEHSVSMKIATKIAVCTDELVSNVIYYSGSDTLHIQCELEDNAVTISFTDNGKPFNPLTDSPEPDITSDVADRKIGGLGIHMVKKMMDSVEYSHEGNKNITRITIKNI